MFWFNNVIFGQYVFTIFYFKNLPWTLHVTQCSSWYFDNTFVFLMKRNTTFESNCFKFGVVVGYWWSPIPIQAPWETFFCSFKNIMIYGLMGHDECFLVFGSRPHLSKKKYDIGNSCLKKRKKKTRFFHLFFHF